MCASLRDYHNSSYPTHLFILCVHTRDTSRSFPNSPRVASTLRELSDNLSGLSKVVSITNQPSSDIPRASPGQFRKTNPSRRVPRCAHPPNRAEGLPTQRNEHLLLFGPTEQVNSPMCAEHRLQTRTYERMTHPRPSRLLLSNMCCCRAVRRQSKIVVLVALLSSRAAVASLPSMLLHAVSSVNAICVEMPAAGAGPSLARNVAEVPSPKVGAIPVAAEALRNRSRARARPRLIFGKTT